AFRRDGCEPDDVPERFANLITSVLAGRPAGMVACIHLCRGNSVGQWAAEGGYGPVAEVLLNQVAVDAYFLEYDDERSGDFAPLRFFPRHSRNRIGPGLVITKLPALQ